VTLRCDANEVVVGSDGSTVVVTLGHDEPVFSVDLFDKLIHARNTNVLSVNLQVGQEDIEGHSDSARLPSVRELGTTKVIAVSMSHSPNGRFVTVGGG